MKMNQNLMGFILEIIYLEKKDGAYIVNLDEYSDTGTHWVSLWVNNSNNVTSFDVFGVENIANEI